MNRHNIYIIPSIYFVVSAVWIFFSDSILLLFDFDKHELFVFAIVKGFLFVIITSLIIYFLIRRYFNALLESNERYKILIENSPFGIFVQQNNKFSYVNNSLTKMIGGGSPDDFIGRSIYELFHPDYHELIRERIHILNDKKQAVNNLEEVILDQYGNKIHVEVSAVPIRFQNQNGVLVFVHNIEERKHHQKRLEESEKQFRAALTEFPLPTMIHDESGTVRFINKTWSEITGYVLDEIPTVDHWTDKVYGADKDSIRTTIHSLYEENQRVYEGEFTIITKEGKTRLWEFQSAPLGNDEKGIRLFLSVANDLTEKREQEDILNALLENAPLIIAYCNSDWECKWVNKQWQQSLGWELGEIQNNNVLNILFTDEQTNQSVLEFVERADGNWHDLQPQTKKGNFIESMWLNIRIPNGFNILLGVDITERKSLEDQLRQSQKMEAIGRLAGGMAHDFNNILMVINGRSDFALEDIPPEHSAYKEIIAIKDAAQRAASLTRQLLAFSRKQIIKPEILNLNTLIQNLDKMIRHLIGEDIELIYHYDSSLHNIKADQGQIEQIIMNFVVNSRDAMPHGGKITFETRNVYFDQQYVDRHYTVEIGHFVMLSVADTGTGMDQDTKEHIFEPFFTTKKEKGTGLGLATVYGIVKQNKGFIFVYSEPGMGSTFKVYFPSDEEQTTLQDVSASTTPELFYGEETILIAEDEEQVRDVIHRALTRYGYTPLLAKDGQEAVELFEKHADEIDMLLTDVVMPGMSGRELAIRILQQKPQLSVLYISGYTENAIVHHSGLDESISLIQKPFSSHTLAQKIREILDENL